MSKSRRKAEELEAPELVQAVCAAVTKRMGRPAIIRKVNNQLRWYVTDLAFSYVQRADRNRNVGYRCGFEIVRDDENDLLLFTLVHAPVIACFFRENIQSAEIIRVVKDTSKYRDYHWCAIDTLNADGKHGRKIIEGARLPAFLEQFSALVASGFNRILFKKATGKLDQRGQTAGNEFSLLLGQNIVPRKVEACINSAWPLFLALYPAEPLFERSASLNRSMGKIPRICEIRHIRMLPKSILGEPCDGTIEAAHIKAYVDGGSDRLENGVWLCQRHHRLTERKLRGRRDLKSIDVAYSES